MNWLRKRILLWQGRISCDVPVGYFIYGPTYCGKVAKGIRKTLDTGEDMGLCEEHLADYDRLKKEAGQ